MNNKSISILLGLNILVTGGLGTLFIIKMNNKEPVSIIVANSTLEEPFNNITSEVKKLNGMIKSLSSSNADFTPLEKPLANMTAEVEKLNATVQRFSTSYVQYDFLKREMDRLAVVDQTIGVRAQATAASKTDENTEEVEAVIGKLSSLSQQVKGQLQTRRQTMLRLISGLEKELAGISSTPLPAQNPPPIIKPVPPKTNPQTTPPTGEK